MAFRLQNSTFHLQKWLFVYKTLLLKYKNCVLNYKVASRITIHCTLKKRKCDVIINYLICVINSRAGAFDMIKNNIEVDVKVKIGRAHV